MNALDQCSTDMYAKAVQQTSSFIID